jgi:hypothetical protein
MTLVSILFVVGLAQGTLVQRQHISNSQKPALPLLSSGKTDRLTVNVSAVFKPMPVARRKIRTVGAPFLPDENERLVFPGRK